MNGFGQEPWRSTDLQQPYPMRSRYATTLSKFSQFAREHRLFVEPIVTLASEERDIAAVDLHRHDVIDQMRLILSKHHPDVLISAASLGYST